MKNNNINKKMSRYFTKPTESKDPENSVKNNYYEYQSSINIYFLML